MAASLPTIEFINEGFNVFTLKVTIRSDDGEVEHFATVDMNGAKGLLVDEIGARYIAPALDLLAHRILTHTEPSFYDEEEAEQVCYGSGG